MTIDHGYITRDELDEHLGDSRGTFGELKDRAIESASRACEDRTSRRFWQDTDPVTRWFRAEGSVIPTLDFTELVSVAPEVSFGQFGTALDTTSYRPGPMNAPVDGKPYDQIELYYSMGWSLHAVSARWGWPAVPSGVVTACTLIAAALFKRRESVNGVIGFDEFAVRVARTDPTVVAHLTPYVSTRALVG